MGSLLEKRTWKPAYKEECYPERHVWYTGFQYGEFGSNPIVCEKDEHVAVAMLLKPIKSSSGRSSVVMVFADKHNNEYQMATKGFERLFKLISTGKVRVINEFFYVICVQNKQGQNYFIEPYDDYYNK